MDTKMPMNKQIIENDILLNVNLRFRRQVAKGLEKYGETVNPESYTTLEWIEHAQEELMDAMVYLEVLKEKLTPLVLDEK